METSELQKKIITFTKKWQEARKYTATEEFTVIHLTEELGELAEQYVSQKIRPDKFSKEELDNAIADIFMQLTTLANLRGIDIEELLLKTMEEDKPRQNG